MRELLGLLSATKSLGRTQEHNLRRLRAQQGMRDDNVAKLASKYGVPPLVSSYLMHGEWDAAIQRTEGDLQAAIITARARVEGRNPEASPSLPKAEGD